MDTDKKARMYVEAPFDLMYGFRGRDENVDVLTPYEMLLWYSPQRILPPSSAEAETRSAWTPKGTVYQAE